MTVLEPLFHRLKGKIVLLGVGNPLRGDDGAGPQLIQQLKGKIDAVLLDCGEVPENFLDEIAKIHPDIVLIIDAVNLGMNPGAVSILEEESLGGMGWSTHHASLRPFIKYVKADTEANVLVLGIQPKSTEFGSKISDEVEETLGLLEHVITKNFRPLTLP